MSTSMIKKGHDSCGHDSMLFKMKLLSVGEGSVGCRTWGSHPVTAGQFSGLLILAPSQWLKVLLNLDLNKKKDLDH